MLVIGDPACDRAVYPRLFGARREAAAVAACLGKQPSADERLGIAAAADNGEGAGFRASRHSSVRRMPAATSRT